MFKKWRNILQDYSARFSKYVWPFFNIPHDYIFVSVNLKVMFKKWPNMLQDYNAKFLKNVWPFFNILHETVKKNLLSCVSFSNTVIY